jgi:hypothetical protein
MEVERMRVLDTEFVLRASEGAFPFQIRHN